MRTQYDIEFFNNNIIEKHVIEIDNTLIKLDNILMKYEDHGRYLFTQSFYLPLDLNTGHYSLQTTNSDAKGYSSNVNIVIYNTDMYHDIIEYNNADLYYKDDLLIANVTNSDISDRTRYHPYSIIKHLSRMVDYIQYNKSTCREFYIGGSRVLANDDVCYIDSDLIDITYLDWTDFFINTVDDISESDLDRIYDIMENEDLFKDVIHLVSGIPNLSIVRYNVNFLTLTIGPDIRAIRYNRMINSQEHISNYRREEDEYYDYR